MNKNRSFILPALVVFCMLLFIWGSVGAQGGAYASLENKVQEIKNLPSGTQFTLTLTDKELTDAANELLTAYKADIQKLIKEYSNMNVNLSDPKISFSPGVTELSIKAGVGFLKVKAKVTVAVFLENGAIKVDVKSVDLPVVTLSPQEANSYVQPYLDLANEELRDYLDIQSFAIDSGNATITCVKK